MGKRGNHSSRKRGVGGAVATEPGLPQSCGRGTMSAGALLILTLIHSSKNTCAIYMLPELDCLLGVQQRHRHSTAPDLREPTVQEP